MVNVFSNAVLVVVIAGAEEKEEAHENDKRYNSQNGQGLTCFAHIVTAADKAGKHANRQKAGAKTCNERHNSVAGH